MGARAITIRGGNEEVRDEAIHDGAVNDRRSEGCGRSVFNIMTFRTSRRVNRTKAGKGRGGGSTA
jgi:hypothetical protein